MVKNQTRPALSAFILMLTMSLLTTALMAMPIFLALGLVCLLGAFRNVED